MKNKRYIIITLLALLALGSSCGREKFEKSIYDIVEPRLDELAQWVRDSFVTPYNIEVLYRWEDMETDMSHNLVPPTQSRVKRFLQMVKISFIDTYVRLVGKNVVNPIFPKQLLLLGTGAFSSDGTISLGTADAGKKIILYNVDEYYSHSKSRDTIRKFVHTMHHEFMHILNQQKAYQLAFKKITPASYTISWFNESETSALTAGFVTPYAMAEPDEDIAETFSNYVDHSQTEWDNLLSRAPASGRALIQKKVEMVRTYMEEAWHIDMDALRDLIQQSIQEVASGNF
ncbi:MAG: putative zinc-binding metallopeptidase [Odoribacteraceae bacterium]|jgi:substrate import-associated zinc metallohydrolase lipoprotein|nr:putative zinc-binding metallopeptidase [Odoribacteraceae bacterium]